MSRPHLWKGIGLLVFALALLFLAFVYPKGAEVAVNVVIVSGATIFILVGLWAVLKKEYTCKDAKRDIDFFFSDLAEDKDEEKEEALQRAIYKHMTKGTTLEEHKIACISCWKYYHEMKQEHCGG